MSPATLSGFSPLSSNESMVGTRSKAAKRRTAAAVALFRSASAPIFITGTMIPMITNMGAIAAVKSI